MHDYCFMIGVYVRFLRGLKFFVRSSKIWTCPAPAWIWKILPAPAPHTSNPQRRPQTMPIRAHPHIFGLKPAHVRKLPKTHN